MLAFLTPPPLVVPEDYDGVEYKWKFLVFRPGREFIHFANYSLIS